MTSIAFEFTFKNQPFLKIHGDDTIKRQAMELESYVPPFPNQDP